MFVLLVTVSFAHAVIVVEPVEPGAKEGVSLELAGSYKKDDGTVSKEEYSAGTKIQYDWDEQVTFLIANYDYATVDQVKNSDAQKAHLRYLYGKFGALVPELFLQQQKDEFAALKSRTLEGAGIRWRVFKSDKNRFYIGLGAYAEQEELSNDDTNSYTRFNSYIAYVNQLNEMTSASLTLYYQPDMADSSDRYILADAQITFKLTEKLSLKGILSHKEDTEPPTGIEEKNTKTTIAFDYKL